METQQGIDNDENYKKLIENDYQRGTPQRIWYGTRFQAWDEGWLERPRESS